MSDDNSPSRTGDDDAPAATASARGSGSSPQDVLDLTLSDSDEDEDDAHPSSSGAAGKSRLYMYGNYGKSLRPRDTSIPQKRSAPKAKDTPKVVTPRGGTTRKRLKKIVTGSSNSSSSESPTPQKRVQVGDVGYQFHQNFEVRREGEEKGKIKVFHGEVVEIVPPEFAGKLVQDEPTSYLMQSSSLSL